MTSAREELIDSASTADAGGVAGQFSASGISSGQAHTCVLVSGAILCWGNNSFGALGTGDSEARGTPTQVGEDEDWLQVVAGDHSTCGRRIDGTAWCWGSNEDGEVGQPALEPHLTPQRVEGIAGVTRLAMKFNVTCAIRDDRTLWCWGDDFEGQLAQGDAFDPARQPTPTPSQVQENADWVTVDSGQGHVCGIRAPGDLWCWGRNVGGELGLGEGTPGQLRTPQRVAGDSDWVAVSAGQLSTCGLRVNGTLWCWGQNQDGQLGLGESTDAVFVPTQIGASHNWSQVSINTFGGCGIQAGSLWCWGRNDEGQLGVGDIELRTAPTRVDSKTDWIEVSSGRFHTCARRADGSVWCTGENTPDRPLLAVGDLERRNLFTPIVPPAELPR